MVNAPQISGISRYHVNENNDGAIIGRITGNDNEDGSNINYSIESELDGDLFTITDHGNFGSGFSGSYLYLKTVSLQITRQKVN